ncbi:MAG TPA: hypothetical protein VF587_13370, partial [Solirubrobacteraceae bacterium]
MPFTLPRPGRLPLAVPAFALCLLAALALAGVPTAPSPPAPAATTTAVAAPNVGPSLATLADRSPRRRVEVIVQLRREDAAGAATAAVEHAGGRVTRRLPLVKGLVARLPAGAAAALGAREDVRAVSLNAAVESSGVV